MTLHQNAKTCPASRKLMCERIAAGWSLAAAAEAAGVSERRAREWRRRWEAGDGELKDRLSVAHAIPGKTPADVEEAVCALRELRFYRHADCRSTGHEQADRRRRSCGSVR